MVVANGCIFVMARWQYAENILLKDLGSDNAVVKSASALDDVASFPVATTARDADAILAC